MIVPRGVAATAAAGDGGADTLRGGALAEDVLAGALAGLLDLAMHAFHLFSRAAFSQARQIREDLEQVVGPRRLGHGHQCINGRLKAIQHRMAVAPRVELQVVRLQPHLVG